MDFPVPLSVMTLLESVISSPSINQWNVLSYSPGLPPTSVHTKVRGASFFCDPSGPVMDALIVGAGISRSGEMKSEGVTYPAILASSPGTMFIVREIPPITLNLSVFAFSRSFRMTVTK